MISKHFSRLQLRGLNRLGDVVIPGDKDLPGFSDLGVEGHIDRILDYMNEDDKSGLKLVMTIFAFCPKFLIFFILWLTEKASGESFIASQLRLVNTGLKGVIFTLYYSNLNTKSKVIHEVLEWDAKIVAYPEEGDEMQQLTDEAIAGESQRHFDTVLDATTMRKFSRQAEPKIRALSVEARLRYIARLKEVILEKREMIIDRIQKDNGKSRTDALVSEIFGVLDHLAWLEKYGVKALADEKVPTPIAMLGKSSKIYYEPMGTVLIISPWNYPFYQAIVPITASFVAGNAVIYKPSEVTPLTGLIEELLQAADFQPNWVQVAYGEGKMGADLIDQRPDKIFFTGSVATGKKIMSQASQYLIPVELELGGKDPSIVFDDANLERAVRGVLWGALTCTGQSCTSVEQVFVHESIYDQFKKMLLVEVAKIRMGTDSNGEGEIGRMTASSQTKIVAEHLTDALEKGATLLSGDSWDRESDLIPPLVLEDMKQNMLMVEEETFGPIVPLRKFSSEQELIDELNSSKYGLSASIWSADKARCDRVARALKTGNVSINNVMLTEGNHNLPFGGVKDSGIGRYKGIHGLRAFCHSKSILIDANSAKCEVNWFPYTEKKYKSFDKMMVSLFSQGVGNFVKFALTGVGLESYSDKIAKK